MTFSQLDRVVEEILSGLHEHFGYDSLWITAGSAIGILDSCFYGEPLRMRDFDLVLLAERRVTREWACSMGERLDSPSLRFIPRYLWQRSRFHPDRPTEKWNAGWGLIFEAAGVEVDLSIFHDAAAHDTNGLLDIHRVRIPVSRRRPLRRVLSALSAVDLQEEDSATRHLEALREAGWIEDPWRGYEAWRQGSTRVVCWPPIHLEPIQGAIRVIRDSVQKLGKIQLDPALARRLSRAIRLGSNLDTAHLDSRNLLKVLGDDCAARELVMLEALGAFEQWLPGFGRHLAALGFDGLTEVLETREPATPRVLSRLVGLLEPLAAADRQDVLDAVGLMEKELAGELEQRLGSRPASPERRARSAGPWRREQLGMA